MIIITIGDRKSVDPNTDELGRTEVGYTPDMTQRDLFDAARASWLLSPETAEDELYALVVHRGRVVQAIEIDHLVPVGTNRRRIEGTYLRPGHQVYDTHVGKRSPVPPQRNPIRYWSSPFDGRPCLCGCGKTTKRGRFVVGHDQKALHERIGRIGTVTDFVEWFDRAWPAP